MTDITVDADRFGATLEQLLGKVKDNVTAAMPRAVEMALARGEKAWKSNARAVLSSSYSRGGWGKQKKTYTRKGRPSKKVVWYGKTYKTGKYASSINHQMLTEGGELTEGEIGSRNMPGLAHLLEKGHASVGGGFVSGREHIAPAADEAFRDFERDVDRAVERAINDA